MGAYDIETYTDENGYYVPYCVCYIFKNKEKAFYYEKASDLVLNSILKIFKESFSSYIFYVHNLNFDGILILESLSKTKIFKFDAFIRNMQIYNISIFYNNKAVHFRCSFKILPSSLKKISESFNLPLKLSFPYKFSQLNNLNYVGKLPSKLYFNNEND
jgi:hypothetical protein